MRYLRNLLRDESGATAIEYGLLAALIAVAMLAAIGRVGFTLVGLFEAIAAAIRL